MKLRNSTPALILFVLLLGCLLAVYLTRDANSSAPVPKAANTTAVVALDMQLLQTANRMAALAETSDEQDQARQATHLADHELDQAFETALRQAAAYRPPPGPLRDLASDIAQLRGDIAADRDRIAQLTKENASGNGAASDQLALANAELALDQDELEDAQQDLARQGGDPHAVIARGLQEHEIAQQQAAQIKNVPVSPTTTLLDQARTWFALGSLNEQLLAAQQQASAQAASLTAQHDQLEKQVQSRRSGKASQADAATADAVAGLSRLSDLRKTLSEFDQRIQDSQLLAGVYRQWGGLVQARRRNALHLFLASLAQILAIVLLAILATRAIQKLFQHAEHKRMQQMRVIAAVVLQVTAIALILLVFFGVPSQISTVIGLATAGLTVVLKDFIVSFFGWFTLMGKNGIRVGDWVEINGVSGEVVEVGFLKTMLLESGNWTDTGHPTGRQVAFSNSFAMEGHYFNFSTAGQWLWDELAVTLPSTGDPYMMAEEIRKLVERETEADFAKAAEDWERVTSRYRASAFSAKPSVHLRPTGAGLEVVVRYITHAPRRYETRSKLFEVIVDLMHKPVRDEARA